MKNFIRLTNMLLNTRDINMILIKPNKYYIHITSKKFDGYIWNFGGFGFGNISSYNNTIEVCEINHSIDYKIMTDWINKN